MRSLRCGTAVVVLVKGPFISTLLNAVGAKLGGSMIGSCGPLAMLHVEVELTLRIAGELEVGLCSGRYPPPRLAISRLALFRLATFSLAAGRRTPALASFPKHPLSVSYIMATPFLDNRPPKLLLDVRE